MCVLALYACVCVCVVVIRKFDVRVFAFVFEWHSKAARGMESRFCLSNHELTSLL